MRPDSGYTTCPRCGSAARAGSDWCTLCFADLRPVAPPRLVAAARVVPAGTTAPTGLDAPADLRPPAALAVEELAVAEPAAVGTTSRAKQPEILLPCHACGAPVRLDEGGCAACGAGLFDELKDGPASLRLPVIGDVMQMSKGARTSVAVALAVLVIVVLVVVVTVVGAVV